MKFLSALLLFLLTLFFSPAVFAATPTPTKTPTPTLIPLAPPANIIDLQALLLRVISYAVGLAFVALLIMLVFGGFKYLTSGGEPKGVQGAAQTITWALLGMLILILIWLGLRLIQAFSGVNVTEFCLGFRPYCII